jgi:hypothetical protein
MAPSLRNPASRRTTARRGFTGSPGEGESCWPSRKPVGRASPLPSRAFSRGNHAPFPSEALTPPQNAPAISRGWCCGTRRASPWLARRPGWRSPFWPPGRRPCCSQRWRPPGDRSAALSVSIRTPPFGTNDHAGRRRRLGGRGNTALLAEVSPLRRIPVPWLWRYGRGVVLPLAGLHGLHSKPGPPHRITRINIRDAR